MTQLGEAVVHGSQGGNHLAGASLLAPVFWQSAFIVTFQILC